MARRHHRIGDLHCGQRRSEACVGADFHQGIIYDRPPPSRWLPPGALLLDVSFDNVSEEQANSHDFQTLTARVRRVVDGEYRRGTINVVVPLSSCTIPVCSGTEGVIAVRPLPRVEGAPQSYQTIEPPLRRRY